MREQHAFNIARVERRNSALSDGLKQIPTYAIGGWVWVYNAAATIRLGTKAGTDAKVLKAKLSLNWMGPFKTLVIGPSPAEATLMAALWPKNFFTSTSPTTCLVRTPPVESRWFAANLAPTHKTASTSGDTCPQD